MQQDGFFDALAHPTRRHIVKLLSLNRNMSYTELLDALRITETGKLSFHLKKMEILLSQDGEKRYMLSELGKRASLFISEIESPPSPSSEMTGTRIAEMHRRGAAYLLDLIFVFLIYSMVGQTKMEIVTPLTTQTVTTQSAGIYFLLLWVYFTLFEGYKGQSLGKIVLRLRVKKTDGKDIRYPDAALRNFAKSLFILLPFDMLFGVRKRGYLKYFDWFTGTTVVQE